MYNDDDDNNNNNNNDIECQFKNNNYTKTNLIIIIIVIINTIKRINHNNNTHTLTKTHIFGPGLCVCPPVIYTGVRIFKMLVGVMYICVSVCNTHCICVAMSSL